MRKTSGVSRSQLTSGKHSAKFSSVRRSQSGIALIISLLLLTLMSILGLGMVLSVSSDSMINGYYGNYRAAYYAADSGLKLTRQYMANQIWAQRNTSSCNSWGASTTAGYGCTGYPISSPGSLATTVQSSMLSTFGSGFQMMNASTGASSSSWQGYFQLSSANVSLVNIQPPNVTPNPTQCAAGSTNCVYTYQYTITTLGKGPGTQQVKTTETGYYTVSASTSGTGSGTSFSQFGAFIHNFQPDSNPLVYGTLTGPQWTNGSWNFGTGGTYTFTDPVYETNSTISYIFSGRDIDSSATSYTYNNQTIAPSFQQGITLGANNGNPAPLPANDYSQQWAVLDGVGCGEGSNQCGNASSPSPPAMNSTTLNQYLKDITSTAYPSGGTTSGVFFPVNGTISNGTASFTGGGFYVEGSADSITLQPGSSAGIETYTIVQGSTTTTITTNTNSPAQTTVTKSVTSGHTTTTTGPYTISGVPHSNLAGSTNGNPQTMLYVDGSIGTSSSNGLQAYNGMTSATAPAIQDGVQLTIAANGDITVQTNLLYVHEPVTLNTSDTLIPANDYKQVLGLFTNNGNLNLNSPYSNNNLEIDGALAMLANNCSSNYTACGGLNTQSQIGTFTIVGGRSETYAHPVNMSGSNTYYDRRFANGFGPPFFPSTTVNLNPPGTPNINGSFARINWSTTPQN
jgi:Tfp pilus assembly protein PilX